MKFEIPEPLEIAEAELKAHLGASTEAGGKTAEAARALRAELPALEKEHEEVFAALHRLVDAAKAEGKPEVARFAKRLIVPAWIDEAVFFPAALLVGEHLKLKLNKAGCA